LKIRKRDLIENLLQLLCFSDSLVLFLGWVWIPRCL